MKKITKPHEILFEHIAGQFAAIFYETGRSQGMTSVHKTAKAYAAANLEKFLPRAIDHCITLLNRPDIPLEAKELIYDALTERVNDKSNVTSTDIKGLPDIDIMKVLDNLNLLPTPNLQQLKPEREKAVIIKSDVAKVNVKERLRTGTAIGKVGG